QLHQGGAARRGQDHHRRRRRPDRPAAPRPVGYRQGLRRGSAMSDAAASLPGPKPRAAPPQSMPPPTPANIPWLGLLAVLLGTFISTLNTRLSSFGLADVRGAVHAGFDDGAWITTAQTAAQMFITPIAIWIGGVHGPRRVLVEAAAAFAIVS